ncbi:response regulator [Rhodococcus hoagii]|uniref:response regulator n=1 Tax=Rhodococcus hoagii TaxID=43767 RepID=UPI001D2A4D6A|nr:response regulator [Prescottella equi]MBM4522181.1 response regulator [Prescottella equi]MBM4528022.1 response regulator [Prescottella equi]MBM4546280.1 response regulator [Prescottella equi]MBM4573038.1 response regulator [Prescottella equi]MBM4606151.1 response regulator [Prescottella equi]
MIRVLIVEDELLIAEAHRSYVERAEGFSVHAVAHTAKDAMRAVADAAAAGEPVDLVLLDIGLPDASGLDLAVTLGGVRPSPGIIAVTSARDLDVVRTAVARGVVLYLLKPFTFAALREKLEHYRQFRAALPEGGTAVSQRDIDRAMAVLRTTDARAGAPKGVAPHTADLISACVRDAGRALTAAEVAAVVGVSRVTAWRYLERFADDGVLTRETEYGRAGRPQVRYTWAASSGPIR